MHLSDNDIKDIARVCHEANRTWCDSVGDHSQDPWLVSPGWQRDSAIKGVKFAIDYPDAPPSAQHDAWMADKIAHGWIHGPVTDADAKTHPCLVPYDRLPEHQRKKDRLFRAIVGALTAREYEHAAEAAA